MAHSADKITWDDNNKGVSTRDIRAVLGIETDSYDNLCKSGSINMWAKYKPIRCDIPAPLSYNTRKSRSFGLEIPYCIHDVMNERIHNIVYNNIDDGWKYLKPRGSSHTEFYRITDFQRDMQDSDDPTVNLQGYNHNAKLPFITTINTNGFTEKTDTDGTYYEINIEDVNTIVATFTNNTQADISLQEFVDLNASYTDNKVWRPIIQVFCNYINLNSDNYNDRLPWYERDQANVEVAGTTITGGTDSITVSIPVNTAYFTQEKFLNRNEAFHLCVGVGLANDDFSSFQDNSLFIPPYTTEQFQNKQFPFYMRFKVVSHAAQIVVTGFQYHLNSPMPGWTGSVEGQPNYTMYSTSDRTIRLEMEIEKTNQSVLFVPQNYSGSEQNIMKIFVKEYLDGVMQGDPIYLTPAGDSWGSLPDGITIPAGSAGEKATIRATFNTSDYNLGHRTYYFYVSVNEVTGDIAGEFDIYKIAYQQ